MNVLKLKSDRFRDAIEMSMYAFQYQLTESEIEKKIVEMEENTLLGIIENEKLAAKLYIMPFQVVQQGKVLNMGGIAGVATYPEYRRRGYVKELLINSLMEMRQNGQTLSMLSPFYIDFYRKFGWELFSDYVHVSIEKPDLQFLQNTDTGKVIRHQREEYSDNLHIIYEQYAFRHTGMLMRTKEWWTQSVLKDLIPAIYYSNEGKPEGYILYSVAKRKMVVEEFIVLTQEARIGLWNFICQHDSMVETVEMQLNSHEPLTYIFKNPNVKTEIKPYFMARIVDVEKYLNHYPFMNVNDPIYLEVKDEYAPWNEGRYEINNSGAHKIGNSDSEQHDFLKMSINSLTALLMGYRDVHTLTSVGKINGSTSTIKQLQQMIPKQYTFFPDFF